MEKVTLINKEWSRIKVFELFEVVSKSSQSIDAIMIPYCWLYQSSIKAVVKGGGGVETIENARKEYIESLE